ncbi:hypothetical protein [Gordonia hankookensis]|uniref:DUF2267 domain-containing protein n=1 Tax=Gordonia hankookensis TaxID=589403 RepID=A0ABR7W6K3_9ACTN|nr:hypothetical protein [Gordonia hankookensis]MBD1318457.1 hypothetical protein [Gordonia hankookensis]
MDHPEQTVGDAGRRDVADRADADSWSVRIVADPGPPTATVDRIRTRLDKRLSEAAGIGSLTADTETLALNPDGGLLIPERGHALHDDASVVVVITEFPRTDRRRGLIAEVDHRQSTVVVSLPALGLATHRLLPVLVAAVTRIRTPAESKAPHGTRWQPGERDDIEFLAGRRLLSRTRMVAGMVRGNRPWRLIPTLTGLMAAAAATASFGVFYSSIWAMANALSPWRLAGLSVLSVVVMTVWLIANNRLWERGGSLPSARARLYNAATATTVLLNAAVLYVGLFVATACAALAVIDSGFLAQELGRPSASYRDYGYLAWLATSMGTVAGAVGSSADSYEDILSATYGYRERGRRRAEDDHERRIEASRETTRDEQET